MLRERKKVTLKQYCDGGSLFKEYVLAEKLKKDWANP
jgi:hypothetical protein